MFRRSILPAALLLLACAPPATAQCFDYSDFLHDVGGLDPGPGCRAVALGAGRAYVAAGPAGLHILDVGDPLNPTWFNTIDTPGDARAVATAAGLVYVGDGLGIAVIDPGEGPVSALIGGVVTPGLAYGVAVAGDRLFAADGTAGLQVIDITDPTQPEITATVATYRARGVAVRDGLVLVADGSAGLKIIDPDLPGVIGQLMTGGDAYGVAWSGDLVCLATFGTGLQVIDVLDPTAPVLLGSVDTPEAATAVAISGGYAWVADGAGGLIAVDLQDPAHPVLAGQVGLPLQDAKGVAVVPGLAFVADTVAGLRTVAISRVSQPESAAVELLQLSALAAADDLAFAGTSDGYFRVVDLADPAAPVVIGSCFSVKVGGIEVSGPRGIGFNRDGAAQSTSYVVLDLSDPTTPRPAKYLFFLDGARAAAIAGTMAYAASPTEFAVIDVGDVDNAQVLGRLSGTGFRDMVVVGDHVFTVGFQTGLRSIDVSDPAVPAYASSLDLGLNVTGIGLLAGGSVVVLSGDGYVQVVDVDDPTAPVAGARLDTRSSAPVDFAVAGAMVHVNDGVSVEIIDCSDVAAPRSLALVEFPAGTVGRTAVAGDLLVLASGGGIMTLPAQCEPALSVVGETPAPPDTRLRVWPNPFNPRLSVEFTLAKAGWARLTVCDLRGRVVKELFAEVRPAGADRVVWDGADAAGRTVASGVYAVRLDTATGAASQLVTLLR